MAGFESVEKNKANEANETSTLSQAADWMADTAGSVAGKVSRIGLVTVEGAAHTIPGVVKGAVHAFSPENWGETGTKVGIAAAMGVGFRLLLPQAGAARALVGTVMGGMFVYDASRPVTHAYRSVWDDNTKMDDVHKAAQTLGDGMGLFVFDSALAIGAGLYAERSTPRWAKGLVGESRWNKFETYKTTRIYDPETGIIGKRLQRVADFNDRFFGRMARKLDPHKQPELLPLEERYKAISDAAGKIHRSFEDGGFYKKGPRTEDGGRVNFSKMIDALLEGKDPAEVAVPARPGWKLEPRRPDNGEVVIPKKIDASPEVHNLVNKPVEATGPIEGLRAVPPDVAAEFSSANILKLAKVSERKMSAWDERAVAIADAADQFRAPVKAISDPSLKGAKLPPEYNSSRDQILELTRQMHLLPDQQVNNVAFVLRHHEMAGNQILTDHPIALDFNTYARTLTLIMRDGMNRAGVSNKVMKESVPSLFAVMDDGGSGNYTLPIVDGALNRPVTLWPRNQTELAPTLGGINLHEMMHNKAFGELTLLESEMRAKFASEVVARAFKNNGIKDAPIEVPGVGTMPKSEFMTRTLIAQANENTSDMMGTALGGADTALTLMVLLRSLRAGNKLETRNVLGKEFGPTLVEPHGIDVARLKLASHTMRHLGNGDKVTNAHADALWNAAVEASAGAEHYIWASRDVKGKYVAIPMREFDALLPELVRMQFDSPMRTLEGRTFREIMPDMATVVRKGETIGTLMADAAREGRTELKVPFDNKDYTIVQVFGGGTRAWMKLTAEGMNAETALARVSALSENLRSTYRVADPHATSIAPSALKFNGKLHPVAAARQAWNSTVEGTQSLSASALAGQTRLRNFTDRVSPYASYGYASVAVRNLQQEQRIKEEIERNQQK